MGQTASRTTSLKYTLERGVDYPDNDIASYDLKGQKNGYILCQIHCSSNMKCVGFVFSDVVGQESCWLKSSLSESDKTPKDGAISYKRLK